MPPVVILLAEPGLCPERLPAGATDYLAKDALSTDTVARVLRYALQHKQAEERPAPRRRTCG